MLGQNEWPGRGPYPATRFQPKAGGAIVPMPTTPATPVVTFSQVTPAIVWTTG